VPDKEERVTSTRTLNWNYSRPTWLYGLIKYARSNSSKPITSTSEPTVKHHGTGQIKVNNNNDTRWKHEIKIF
jgi:hypothetical protein